MPPLRSVEILLVDDVPANMKLLQLYLESEHYTVRQAQSGREALREIETRAPDLILLDVMMPDMNGFEVTRAIKANAAYKKIPVILVTALSDRSSFIQGLEAGAEEFLTKPVERAELLVRVRNLLRLKQVNDFIGDENQLLHHQVKYLSLYDALTGLPNRRLLRNRMQQGKKGGHVGALLFIDLDHFKNLNNTLGHVLGDMLLQQVSRRLLGNVHENDTVARLGGDEFVIIQDGLGATHAEAAAQARATGEKILYAFREPFQLGENECFSTPSIGIVLFQQEQENVDDLLKRADLAMYQAKASGRNALRFFDPAMQDMANARAALETDLRHGLQRGEFILHYQPQMNADARVTGAEALVRWQHPARGMVAPLDFIPLAEETGQILLLGRSVLEAACIKLAEWAQSSATAHLDMAVNISARQFHHADFVDEVMAIVERTGANPARLKLELTESLLLTNLEDIIDKMSLLQARGITFSLDDFGTGYSSLAYLKRLPLAQLKIDKSFVMDVMTDPNDAAIAQAILGLGHSLGLTVIAEGVETDEQLKFLVENGCHAYQGYLFSRPLSADDLGAFVMVNG